MCISKGRLERGQCKGDETNIAADIYCTYTRRSVPEQAFYIYYALCPIAGTIILILQKISLPVTHGRLLAFEARCVTPLCEFPRLLPKNGNVSKRPKNIWHLMV